MTARHKETIGNAELWLGDCLEILPTLPKVDAVITDPPYSEYVHSKARQGRRSLTADGFMASYSRAAELGFPAITEEQRSGCAKVFADGCRRWVAVFSDVESCNLWRDALKDAGLDYCRTGVWHKQNATPQFTGDRPGTAIEAITIAHPKGRKKWNRGGGHAFWSFPIELNRGGSNPRFHTTQKPLPLMSALIADFTDPNETILDPFMGSGTTGVACMNLDRKFIGIEIEEKYFQIACERIAQAQKQGRLFA